MEEDSKLIYYQLKSTRLNSLGTKEIIYSFELFLKIDISDIKNIISKEYVLVSNASIDTATVPHDQIPFSKLSEAVRNQIRSINGIKDTFLAKTYVARGPSLDEIYSDIVTALVLALRNTESYSYKLDKNSL